MNSTTNYSRSRCPLQSTCCLEEEEALTTHLIKVHGAKKVCVQLKDREGIVEASSPLIVPEEGSRHPPSRRSILIIECEKVATFLWILESKQRADSELQVSISMQLLHMESSFDSFSQDAGSAFKAGNSNSSSSMSEEGDSDNESKSSSSCSTTAISVHEALRSDRFRVTLAVERAAHAPLVWESVLHHDDLHDHLEKQDHLISCGQALVVLYPTHLDAFQAVPPVAVEEKKVNVRELTVRTKIVHEL